MDRYQKVEKPKPESPINENEIRITSQGLLRNYISYASTLLQEKRVKEIVLKAMGQAISKTVAIVEILKKRIPRLHQNTVISSVSITDVWEPIEEGLVPVELTRHVSTIEITLSPRELDKNSPGYQAPLHTEQPRPQYQYQQRQPRQAHGPYIAYDEDYYGRGIGRGRGRRGRGRGRGGYGSYYQDNGGYSNRGRGTTRGRGWGYRDAGYGGYSGYSGYGGYGGYGGGRGRDRDRGGRGYGYGYGYGYGRGRGRMGGRLRGGGNQA